MLRDNDPRESGRPPAHRADGGGTGEEAGQLRQARLASAGVLFQANGMVDVRCLVNSPSPPSPPSSSSESAQRQAENTSGSEQGNRRNSPQRPRSHLRLRRPIPDTILIRAGGAAGAGAGGGAAEGEGEGEGGEQSRGAEEEHAEEEEVVVGAFLVVCKRCGLAEEAPLDLHESPDRDLDEEAEDTEGVARMRAHALVRLCTNAPHTCCWRGCRKTFQWAHQLVNHVRTHTREKPFVCSHAGCDAAFALSGDLSRHFRTHTGEKPHVCQFCGRHFRVYTTLARHRRLHTGEKAYTCTVLGCNRRFALKADRDRHVLGHLDEADKPFCCDVGGCSKQFVTSANLASHKRAVHGVGQPMNNVRGRGTGGGRGLGGEGPVCVHALVGGADDHLGLGHGHGGQLVLANAGKGAQEMSDEG